jgi:hypothetical protein
MLNLNTSNDYSMAFSHHLSSSGDQQFYHNLYPSVPQAPSIKDKNDFPYKNQKFDYINNNATPTSASEIFANSVKDSENSKRFSVNNLLKPPAEASVEKLSGKSM